MVMINCMLISQQQHGNLDWHVKAVDSYKEHLGSDKLFQPLGEHHQRWGTGEADMALLNMQKQNYKQA